MRKQAKKMKRERGITLVALVVTIVIIIILTSVTLMATFGENGIIKKAELARDLATNSTIKENEDMNSLMDEYTNIMSGDGEVPEPPKDETPPTVSIEVGEITETSIAITVNATDDSGEVASYKYYLNGEEQKTDTANTYTFTGLTAGTEYTIKVEAFDKANNKGDATEAVSTKKKENTIIEDDLGNKVWIPGGFEETPDSGPNVEDGIVIEDEKGNQFVWIPVGEYKVSTSINSTGKLTNNLSRRQWGKENEEKEPIEVSEDNKINSYILGSTFYCYGEGDSRSVASNTIATFKAKVNEKGGFYIGRFEQGSGNVCKKNIDPYVSVTRDQAKVQAEAMYSGNSYVRSELMSSYALDTSLNFICQTNAAKYILATTTDSKYGNINTGIRAKTGKYTVNSKVVDKYSNIYDLLGNCYEWTTEYSDGGMGFCIYRGGNFSSSLGFNYIGGRNSDNTNGRGENSSFRIQLYLI